MNNEAIEYEKTLEGLKYQYSKRESIRYKLSTLLKNLDKYPYTKFTVRLDEYGYRRSHRYDSKDASRLMNIYNTIIAEQKTLQNDIDITKMEQLL